MAELLAWMLNPLAKDRPQSCDDVAMALHAMANTSAQSPVPTQHGAAHTFGVIPPTLASMAAAPAPTLTPAPITVAPESDAPIITDAAADAAERVLVEHMGPSPACWCEKLVLSLQTAWILSAALATILMTLTSASALS
jgi:hypothetical protein